MTFVVGYSARAAREADVDAILAVLHAGDAEVFGEPDIPRDFVEEVFASPFLDPTTDIWVVEDTSGSVIACGDLQSVNPTRSCDAFVRVHPAHRGRGVSSALLDLAETRARERLEPSGRTRLWMTADPGDRFGVRLLVARGGTHIRSFLHMQRSLDGVTASAPPEGVAFRPFDPGRRDEWATFHEVLETAFADHFGFEPIDLDTFTTMWTDSPMWDPALVTFADIDRRVVGLVVSNLTATPGLGWLADVGVLPAFRGRGIAQALLLRAFVDLRARGCDAVRLNVDAANTTGATRLYEAVGMHVRREWMVFEKELAAGH